MIGAEWPVVQNVCLHQHALNVEGVQLEGRMRGQEDQGQGEEGPAEAE